jgi:acetyl esterase/lipase
MKTTFRLTVGSLLAILLSCSWTFPALAQETAAPAAFKRLDKNKDGMISREEAKGIGHRFDTLDKNRDGCLTPEETPRGRGTTESPAAGDAVGIVTKMDIRYAEVPPGVDANHLSLDVYAPEDARDAPVMIYIHGGGWRTGDKKAVGAKPAYFTERGYVFVSMNYRLVPAVDILTQHQDSATAIG